MEQISDFFPLLFTFVIIILILYFSYYATRWIGGKTIQSRNSKYMKIVDTLAVTQDKSILIVQADEKNLLLSVSPTGIQLITELENFKSSSLGMEVDEKAQGQKQEFKNLLSQFMPKKRNDL